MRWKMRCAGLGCPKMTARLELEFPAQHSRDAALLETIRERKKEGKSQPQLCSSNSRAPRFSLMSSEVETSLNLLLNFRSDK